MDYSKIREPGKSPNRGGGGGTIQMRFGYKSMIILEPVEVAWRHALGHRIGRVCLAQRLDEACPRWRTGAEEEERLNIAKIIAKFFGNFFGPGWTWDVVIIGMCHGQKKQ